MLPEEAIEEFKKIYKKEFGIDISNTESSRRANNLINLYRIVYEDFSKENIQRIIKNKEK
jgi:hypothetical protein